MGNEIDIIPSWDLWDWVEEQKSVETQTKRFNKIIMEHIQTVAIGGGNECVIPQPEWVEEEAYNSSKYVFNKKGYEIKRKNVNDDNMDIHKLIYVSWKKRR